MSQRSLAVMVAVPLILALWIAALVMPLPYVTYSPGLTVNVLGKDDGQEIIQVTGHRTYRDAGELRMTTVYVTQPEARVNLIQVMGAWLNRDDAVYPHDSVYRPDETSKDADLESALQMVSSQDAAIATALRELGFEVGEAVKVLNISRGMPADGALKVGDVLERIGATEIAKPEDVVSAVTAAKPGQDLVFKIERDDEPLTVTLKPKDVDGKPRVGIVPGPGFTFPFQVHVNISPDIGGPSAGLMFSLAIYDTLTPGSLTDDVIVAGTGTIDEDGVVGPIGGIQQKIVAARQDGASLFMVPPGNCQDALGAPHGSMRLVKAKTMHAAVDAIEAWTRDPDATLPSCSTSSSAKAAS